MLLRLAAFLLLLAAPAQARSFTDAAGRTVELPDKVARVLAAGPPASIAVYVLAPEKLLGWVRELRDVEREFIAEPYVSLPVTGRLTSRGNTARLETVVALRPDVIVDVGSADPTYASLADRVQAQTGIPYVLIDGSFERTPAVLRELGTVLGVATRGEELAGYAEQVLGDVRTRLAGFPEELRPRVYYGRGPEGLDTGLKGSINVEILDLVGARNVAEGAGAGGLATISAEQVLAWDPDVVLTLDPGFYASVGKSPLWRQVQAVRAGRVYLAPSLPFGWFDQPPGLNRLIGVRWLGRVLYPAQFPEELGAVTRDFYRRFYHVELGQEQLDRLLVPATTGPQ
jgi:iron complex transport system substrate-binding protein